MQGELLFSVSQTAVIVRVVAFSFSLLFFPFAAFPLIFRLAILLAALFLLGSAPSLDFDLSSLIAQQLTSDVQLSLSLPLPNFTVLLFEVILGVTLATLVNLAAYAVRICARWVTQLVFSDSGDVGCSLLKSRAVRNANIEALFVLVFLAGLSLSPGLAIIFEPLVAVLSLPSPELQHSLSTAGLAIAINVLKLSFSLAFFGILPILVVSLIIDIVSVLLARLMKEGFSASMVHSVRLPVLVVVLSLSLMGFARELAEVMASAVSEQQVAAVLGLVP